MDQIIKNFMKDVRINLADEFVQNFERKAFFTEPWSPTKLTNNRGSLMMRTGGLRNSIDSNIQGENIVFSSSLPYASIHNEGGEITVTKKMKSFFWAMYYKAGGAVKGTSPRDVRLSQEAQQWKNMALMKIGQKIKIEQRQFIGDHPEVGKAIEFAFNKNMKDLEEYISSSLKQNK